MDKINRALELIAKGDTLSHMEIIEYNRLVRENLEGWLKQLQGGERSREIRLLKAQNHLLCTALEALADLHQAEIENAGGDPTQSREYRGARSLLTHIGFVP